MPLDVRTGPGGGRDGIVLSVRLMLAAFLPIFIVFYLGTLAVAAVWETAAKAIWWPAMHVTLAIMLLNAVALRLSGRKTVGPALFFYVSARKFLKVMAEGPKSYWAKVAALILLIVVTVVLKADLVEVILTVYAAIAVLFWGGSQRFTLSAAGAAVLACPISLAFGSQAAADQFGTAAFFLLLTALLREAADKQAMPGRIAGA